CATMMSDLCFPIMRSIEGNRAPVNVANVLNSDPTTISSSGLIPNHSSGSCASAVCWPEQRVVTCECCASSRMSGANLMASGRVPTTQRNHICHSTKDAQMSSHTITNDSCEHSGGVQIRLKTSVACIKNGFAMALMSAAAVPHASDDDQLGATAVIIDA